MLERRLRYDSFNGMAEGSKSIPGKPQAGTSDHDFRVNGVETRQTLDGVWRFKYSRRPQDRPVDFFKSDYDIDGLDSISVPGHIQLQGFGRPQYVNTQYPWEGHEGLTPPEIPGRINPVGSYVRTFDLDPKLVGMDTFISFQGVATAFMCGSTGSLLGILRTPAHRRSSM